MRIKLNMIKGAILLVLFVVLGFHSIIVKGQTSPSTRKQNVRMSHFSGRLGTRLKGLSGSYGIRVFTLQSNIPALNHLSVLQEGGHAGLFFGNHIWRTKVGLMGFFYSASRVPRTINVFETEIAQNFYPLNRGNKTKMIEPYLAGGLVYNNIRFKGHYNRKSNEPINMSAPEPFVGAIHKIDLSVGMGLEVGLLNNLQFVHFFTETKYGINLYQAAAANALQATSVSNQFMVTMGMRFGAFH
ncbi:MAG TPA: hypothetical protein VFW11_16895 [Cyclobacteriaceae bacterium]|nr:hypothetical protein [Cyclobacteriaceae bacterium]